MLTFLLLVVLASVFVYGVYIAIKGEVKVNDGNVLKGGKARLIGILFALSPVISFLIASFIYIVLLLIGIDLAAEDIGSRLASLLALAIPLLLMLILINRLSIHLHSKQMPNEENDT